MPQNKMFDFNPFENEAECITLDAMSIENRLLHVSLFGSLNITKDKKGLENALILKGVLDSIVEKLECEELPDEIEKSYDEKTVPNPFIGQDS